MNRKDILQRFIIAPILLLIAISFIFLVVNTDFSASIYDLTFTFSLIATILFGFMYSYSIYRNIPGSEIVAIVAYILVAAVLVGIAILINGLLSDVAGEVCTGLFGAREPCWESNLFVAAMFFFNPVSSTILLALSLSGIIMLIKSNQKNTKVLKSKMP